MDNSNSDAMNYNQKINSDIQDERTPDIFDKIMHIKPFSIFESVYIKNKSVLLYLFFGGLTTLVSIFTFWLSEFLITADLNISTFGSMFSLKVLLTNAISWVCAVLFAFFTNRTWVFKSPTNTLKEFLSQMAAFFGGRFATFLLETVILLLFVSVLNFNELAIKIIAQFVVLVSNYIISKLVIFKDKRK